MSSATTAAIAGAPATRFVGTSVHRKEDARLLTGHGRYVDDVAVPGMVHAAFVRSDIARGRIVRIDTEAAKQAPGVVAVFTAAELNPRLSGSMQTSIVMGRVAGIHVVPFAEHDVRHVGEPIALVIATSRYLAEDAAELVEVEIDALAPVLDYEQAVSDTERLVWPELGTNVVATMENPIDPELDEIFARAPHVITQTFNQHRYIAVPMETRGVVASWDAQAGELRVWVSTQSPHDVRAVAGRITGVPEHQIRVSAGDVGGGFGQKAYLARDEQVVILAAHLLRAPLKWIEDRRENLIAATHSRVDRVTVKLALDADGRILGGHIDHLDDLGACPLVGGAGAYMASMFTGPYRIPKLAWKTTSVVTNTCPRAPYRGPWQAETLAREQMIDVAARDLGIDPIELRRRNVIHRSELPHTMPSGIPLMEVSPEETLEQAVEMIDYSAFRREQEAARREDRYLGIGFGLYIEPQLGNGPYATEPAHIRVQPSGQVDVYLGSGSHGQGIETTTAQLVAEFLGVRFEDVSVHQGDTAGTPFAFGTGGSRSGPVMGAAIRQAAQLAREKVVAIAAHLLEAAPEDLEVADSVVSARGTPSRSVTFADIATVAYQEPERLPPDMEAGLEVLSRYKAPPIMFSNSCHVCTVDIDPHLGFVKVLRYVVSEDCGVMINPAVVEGQIDGGIVQGIGGMLYEEFVYDEYGNPLTATFLDYLLPTSAEIPRIEHGHLETPALTPGGYKGVGEGGAIGSPAAVANAVNDALAHLGVGVVAPPMTPNNVLAAIAAAAVA